MNNRAVHNAGISLVELIVTLSILAILASVILPSAQMISKRNREIELRRNLRTIRMAIDDYKKTYDKCVDDKKIPNIANKNGYPETLDQLVEGSKFYDCLTETKKFLRRVPLDPFSDKQAAQSPDWGWGLRSYTDKPDSSSWGREDVYDVYSLSDGTAIDGTKYKDW